MKPLGLMHVGLLAIALINMIPVVQVEDSWGLWMIAVSAAALSCFLAKPEGGTRVSTEMIYVLVGLASVYLLYEMFWPQAEPTVYVVDLAHFMMFLASCKFFELQTNRDVALVMVIAGLLILISAFASASPLFGAVVVFDITFGVYWLLAFQTQRETDAIIARRQLAWRAAGAGPAPAPLDVVPMPATGYLGATAWCFSGLTVIGLLMFVAMPRGWGRGIFSRIQGVIPAAVTGFSEEIQLGDATMFENETPVMRVRLRSTARGFKAADYQPYLRGMTFERYDHGRWHELRRSPRPIELASGGSMTPISTLADTAAPSRLIEQEISLEHIGAGCLFSLYPPLAVATNDLKTAEVDRSDFTLHTEERPRGGIRYVVRSLDRATTEEIAALDPPPPRRTMPSTLSAISPEVREFAKEFFGRFGDPADAGQHESLVRRACEYLRSEAFEYTLSRGRRLRGVDPIKDFLFDNPRGHCEYFASALAVLCQAVNIPARLVNGYYGGEYDAAGGYHQFRQNDAHAWVEVYLAGKGWVAFDPSPSESTHRVKEELGLWARSRRFADYLQYKWSTLVSFDADSRYDLIDTVTRWLRHLNEDDDRKPATLSSAVAAFLWGPEVLPLWQRFFYWLLLVLCTVFVILIMRVLAIVFLMVNERLPFGPFRGRRKLRRPEARFYDRLLLLLANKGHVKPMHVSPKEFAADLARSHHDLAAMPRLTDWFYHAQYGHQSLGKDQWTEVREFLQRLREDPFFGTR